MNLMDNFFFAVNINSNVLYIYCTKTIKTPGGSIIIIIIIINVLYMTTIFFAPLIIVPYATYLFRPRVNGAIGEKRHECPAPQ